MEDFDKKPYVSDELIDYLERTFGLTVILYDNVSFNSSEERIGYMKGVNCIISNLKSINKGEDDVLI